MKKNLIRTLLFFLGGMLLGYLYYYFIGCDTGCVISSYPLRSSLYGGVVGIVGSFIFWEKTETKPSDSAKS